MSKPIVAIVGRPNVGKSMLFNKLTGKRMAIVEDTPGVTRDRIYGECEWNGRGFALVDTGGIEPGTNNEMLKFMRRQAEIAIETATVIIMVVDVTVGLTAADAEVASMLKRSKKPVVLAVNKMDSTGAVDPGIYEFYSLGLGDPIAVSAVHGHGTGDLLDACLEHFPPEDADDADADYTRVAVIGKPNVGKSSLTNALLDRERNIVTPIAGTTRDSILTRYNKFGMDFYLIDTAGLRKKTKVTDDLEFYSVLRSIRSIESSDVCILMFDASAGVEAQDMNIFRLIERNKKGCVIVINKWDLVEKSSNTMKEYAESIRRRIAPFDDVPIVFTSVLNKQRILDVLQTAMNVYYARIRRIPTSALNEYLLPIIEQTPPPSTKGKYIRIKYVTQLASPTPAFAFFVNLPQYIKEGYRRFLENKIRERWDFKGVPIQIFFRQK